MDEKMGMARIPTPICIECGKGGTILVQMSDYLLWQSKDRPLIQNCFPALSREQREQILTGIHPECWEKIFPPEVEEEFGEDEVFPIRQGEPPEEFKDWKNLPGTADEEIIKLYEQLKEEEQHNCRQCQEEVWGPSHFLHHSIIETDGGRQLVVSTGKNCGGNGRRFDVEKREFVGNRHCTCDACF